MDEDQDVDLRKSPTMVSAPSSDLRRLAETTTGGQDTEGTKAGLQAIKYYKEIGINVEKIQMIKTYLKQ